MLKPAIMAACLCAAAVAEAESVRLSGREISELVAGATVEIDTPLGTKLPVRYTVDGKISGQARDLASYLGAASDTGQWWVASDHLCHKWNRWFDSEPQCLRLMKAGRTIHWRSQDGNSGTAVIAVPAPIQTAAVQTRAQVETKMHVAAPAPPPAAAIAQPAQMRTASEQSLGPVVAETPAVDPAVAQAPSTFAEIPPPRLVRKPPGEPTYLVANVGRDDVLNVRSGPSTEFDIVGELQPGSRGISITGACRSEWCPVHHQSTSGWVNRMYLAKDGRDFPGRMARMSGDDD